MTGPLIGGLARHRIKFAGQVGYAWNAALERKFKYRTADGCEVERKWKKGEYDEKVKCKPGRYGYGYCPALPLSTRKKVCRPKHGRHRVNPQWQLLCRYC